MQSLTFLVGGPASFVRTFTFSDVDHGPGVLNEIPARAENRMTNAVNVPDGATRMHNAIIHFFVQLVMPGLLGRFPECRLIVGMNSPDEFFHSGQTIPWIKTQNAVTFLRPIPDVGVGTPGPTACVTEPLCSGQVGFTALQLLSQLFLLSYIHSAAETPCENPVV